jgi:DNA-binding CsgD family transcriptional regulator
MISAPVFCREFIGREKEIELLVERVRNAAHGTGSVVLVGGEAGIGKTRFVEEARGRVVHNGGRFTSGGCDVHSQSPLGPIVEALRELNASSHGALTEVPRLRFALARLLPELQLGDAQPQAVEDRRGQYEAIIVALRHLGADAPVLVAIEDAHWADLATLEFLRYAAERVAHAKLVLVVTYRSDELNAHHPLTSTLAKVSGRTCWSLTLPPLSDAEMRRLASDALEGYEEARMLPLGEILRLAEGSPLFAEELLRHALEPRGQPGLDVELPLSVRALVLERMGALLPDDRMTLSYAAVIGTRFDAEMLARMRGRTVDEIVALLRRVRDLQLIREERGRRGSYVFRHALVREALYEELLWDEARPMHIQIAQELAGGPDREDHVIELAYHWWAAREAAQAARYNTEAGDLAASRLAHEDAVRFYERALEFVDEGGETQAVLYRKLATALNLASPGHRSLRAYQKSLAYYERVGDRASVVDLLLAIGRAQWQISDADSQVASVLRALEIMESTPDDPRYFAALVESVAMFALRGDPQRAEHYIELADHFGGSATNLARSRFHNFRGVTRLLQGNVTGLIEDYETALRLANQEPDAHNDSLVRVNYGYATLGAGELAIAQRAFDEHARFTREHFHLRDKAYCLAGAAELDLLRGELERARSRLRESRAVLPSTELPWILIQRASVAIPVGLRLGDSELVERYAREEIVALAYRSKEDQWIAPISAAFAEWYAVRGEPERARELVDRAIDALHGVYSSRIVPAVAQYGSPTAIRRAHDLLSAWAAGRGCRAGIAYLALFRAIVAGREGRDARELAGDAARRCAELGLRLYEALAYELAARPREALALSRTFGDVAAVRRLEAVLSPVNRRGRASNELTAREREIAQLIAAGRSNRAIAEQLVVGERTVESHVASILGKLGVASRGEVAAHVLRGARAHSP